MKRTDLILAGGVVALAGLLVWVVAGTLTTPVINAGDRAPNFKVTTEDGRILTPTNFGGKLLVLNFWASWCDPCKEETPSLEAMSRLLGDKGVVVLGISMDQNEKAYKDFLSRYRISFKTSRDPSWDITASYGTLQLPDSYIIDPSGKVVQKVVNAQNWMAPDVIAGLQKML